MKKGVIIQASSRSNGDTHKVVTILKTITKYDVIDLNKKNITHFDYEFKNENDDFKTLFKNVTTHYSTIVFATPIYWYTMSGLLKVFFDRISDFLNHEKHVGRKLRTMKMAIVSCSNENMFFNGFTMPFKKSADYLGMQYLGHIHTWVKNENVHEDVKNIIKDFAQKNLLTDV